MRVLVAIIFLVLAVVCLVALIVGHYSITNEIEGWKNRAQVSSEPNDMYQYMSRVKAGMEKWGMTNGNAALIFKTPDNDMALIYNTVNQHVDQAKVLTTMNRATPEYQTGLDNLRGSIRELNLETYPYWDRHGGLIYWIGFFVSLLLVSIASSIAKWFFTSGY